MRRRVGGLPSSRAGVDLLELNFYGDPPRYLAHRHCRWAILASEKTADLLWVRRIIEQDGQLDTAVPELWEVLFCRVGRIEG